MYRQGSCWAQLTKDGELASLTGAADGEIEELALARLMECCKAQEAPEAQTHWSLTNDSHTCRSGHSHGIYDRQDNKKRNTYQKIL